MSSRQQQQQNQGFSATQGLGPTPNRACGLGVCVPHGTGGAWEIKRPKRGSNQIRGFAPTEVLAPLSRPALRAEQSGRLKLDLLLHDPVTGPAQFVGQGLDRQSPIGLGGLAFHENPCLAVGKRGVVGGFHKGPGQVAVAAFGVVLPLLSVVGPALAGHTRQ